MEEGGGGEDGVVCASDSAPEAKRGEEKTDGRRWEVMTKDD